MYRVAWQALRDDRHYGAMGGLSRIHYGAISQYARDNGMSTAELAVFARLMHAMDDEYIAYVTEKQKAEADKAKNGRDS